MKKLTLLALCVPALSHAQESTGAPYVSDSLIHPFSNINYGYGSNSPDSPDDTTGLQGDHLFGFETGVKFKQEGITDLMGILSFEFFGTKNTLETGVAEAPEVDATVFGFMGNAKIGIKAGPVEIFAGAGIGFGVVNLDADEEEIFNGGNFVYQFTVGAEFYFTEKLSVFGQVRYIAGSDAESDDSLIELDEGVTALEGVFIDIGVRWYL